MLFRKNKLISALRTEVQRLREALAEAIGSRDAYREQAREAIGLAKEKHFPEQAGTVDLRHPNESKHAWFGDPDCADCLRTVRGREGVYWPGRGFICCECWKGGKDYIRTFAADPNSFSVKNCPECCVSVRSDTWPVACPACRNLFGDEEWPDELG